MNCPDLLRSSGTTRSALALDRFWRPPTADRSCSIGHVEDDQKNVSGKKGQQKQRKHKNDVRKKGRNKWDCKDKNIQKPSMQPVSSLANSTWLLPPHPNPTWCQSTTPYLWLSAAQLALANFSPQWFEKVQVCRQMPVGRIYFKGLGSWKFV